MTGSDPITPHLNRRPSFFLFLSFSFFRVFLFDFGGLFTPGLSDYPGADAGAVEIVGEDAVA